MKKRIVSILAAALLTGCGSSGGSLGSQELGLDRQGNFVSTTVEIEQRYLYVLNSEDSSISAFTFPIEVEEEGHGHDHSHGRVLAQEDHDHEGEEEEHAHEEGEEHGGELEELADSPITLDHIAIDMAVVSDSFLVTLDPAGAVRSFSLNRTGLEGSELFNPGVANPRRLILTEDGVAVLGDSLAVLRVDESGRFTTVGRLNDTADWVDAQLDGELGAASTTNGAVGFTLGGETFEVALPGGERGRLTYAEPGLFVLNTADGSVSLLSQGEDGSLTLEETFSLGDELLNPTLIVSLFDGEDILIADSDSVGLFHPEDGELEDEGSAELEREPVRLFHVADSEIVYVGHAQGDGSTTVLIEEEGPEVAEETGPGHDGPTAFGIADRVEEVTVTTGF